MKRCFVMLLAAMLVGALGACALAEDGAGGGFFDSLGSFLSDTLDQAGEWTESALGDAAEWVDNALGSAAEWVDAAWGDASKWINRAWNDSSAWVAEIWGATATWASDAYSAVSDGVSAWWVETFNTVSDQSKNAWTWVKQSKAFRNASNSEALARVTRAVSAAGDTAEARVREAFDDLLVRLKIDKEDANRVWDSVQAYAKQKGIDGLNAARLVLPYIYQLATDSASYADESIPAVAVAQYLTGVMEKLGIGSDEDVIALIDQLNETLAGM